MYATLRSSRQSSRRGFSEASRRRPSSTMSTGDAKETALAKLQRESEAPCAVPSCPSGGQLLMLNAPEWKQGLVGSFSAIVSGDLRLSPMHSLPLASAPATSALASTLAPAAPVHRLQQATASGYSTRGPIRSRHLTVAPRSRPRRRIANASPRSRLPIVGRWQ
jgi:hypothetical protein